MNDFKYVFIPCDSSKPVEERIGDGKGGLTADELGKVAKEYFNSSNDGVDLSEKAEQIRQQVIAAGGDAAQINALSNEAIVDMVKDIKTCEITALTVPTKLNQHLAVSMYSDDHSRNKKLPLNERATELKEGCGSKGEIYGDAFVGRCMDDEASDIWKRVDFLASEINPDSGWCQIAKMSGGGSGSSFNPNLAAQMLQTKQQQQPFLEQEVQQGVKWSQNQEEVEIRIPNVPAGTKAKYIKVLFQKTSLKLTITGQTMLNGKTGGEVDTSNSTWTLEGQELCITLCKNQPRTWTFAIQ